jgi:hypothetical protein
MDTSIGTGRSPSLNKENTSDIIHRLREGDSEQNQAADPKILQRATLKIDLYLIPMVGMFCVPFLPLVSPSTTNCLPPVQICCRSW